LGERAPHDIPSLIQEIVPARSLVADACGSWRLCRFVVTAALAAALFSGAAMGAMDSNDAGSFKDNWPRFRGPDGTGVVKPGDWPTKWDAETGENVLWKTPVPAPGNSSPLLWGNRVFLTGADADRQEVLCFERSSGKLLWRTTVAAPRGNVAPDDIKVLPETGYASPTPATDGRRVYATYASSDVAAVDFDGKVVWARNLGKPESPYGRASSLLVYKDKVIVQFDRGAEPKDGLSALLALDAKTGKTVWSAPRPVRSCWCTPILVPAGERVELVANGSPWIMAYDPETGRELWRCAGMADDVACSPTFAGGLVFVTNENAKVLAIRPGGVGDVTQTNVAWSAEDGMSDAASPVADDKFFLQATTSGRVTCYGARSGKLLWERLLGCALWASPTLAGNRVYLPGGDGKVYILELSDKPNLVAACNLGEPSLATPAFGDGCIYFRGKTSLFCVGSDTKTR
jgi:outer membrane protein assembly factor BamB